MDFSSLNAKKTPPQHSARLRGEHRAPGWHRSNAEVQLTLYRDTCGGAQRAAKPVSAPVCADRHQSLRSSVQTACYSPICTAFAREFIRTLLTNIAPLRPEGRISVSTHLRSPTLNSTKTDASTRISNSATSQVKVTGVTERTVPQKKSARDPCAVDRRFQDRVGQRREAGCQQQTPCLADGPSGHRARGPEEG